MTFGQWSLYFTFVVWSQRTDKIYCYLELFKMSLCLITICSFDKTIQVVCLIMSFIWFVIQRFFFSKFPKVVFRLDHIDGKLRSSNFKFYFSLFYSLKFKFKPKIYYRTALCGLVLLWFIGYSIISSTSSILYATIFLPKNKSLTSAIKHMQCYGCA